MKLYKKKMTKEIAMDIITWKYAKPYDFYNMELTDEAIEEMLTYYAVFAGNDRLIGFFCVGSGAQVPIGHQYGVYKENFIDIGFGMKPELTGKGNGADFLAQILRFIDDDFPNETIRLSVATFNKRAIHLYEKFGFVQEIDFHTDTAKFITMVKQVNENVGESDLNGN